MHRAILPVCLSLSTCLAAQSGPWEDGELVLRSDVPGTGKQALYRVSPETGDGELLLEGFAWSGWAGSMAFDPFRGGLLGNFAKPGDVYTQYRLYLVGHDGSISEIPGFYKKRLRALCPVGDGRVYYQLDQTGGPHVLRYLDEKDQAHDLLDAGGAPFELAVDHVLYDEPSNALVATASAAWLPGGCVAFESSIYRIPLTADGTQVAGPVLCQGIGEYSNVKSLDFLPGGDVLLTHEGAQYISDTMWRYDPVTLTRSLWASPSPPDIDGAVWSERIGRAILLDDTNDVLRLYDELDTGWGSILASDVPVSPGTVGYSPVETLVEVRVPAPPCAGAAIEYGAGLAGSGGFVPHLWVDGCPQVGNVVYINVDQALGGTVGFFALGGGAGSAPFAGGTLLVSPVTGLVQAVLDGDGGVAGAGSKSLWMPLANPSMAGVTAWIQVGLFDTGAPQNVSLSNGLLFAIG